MACLNICEVNAIHTETDIEGFYYPTIDSRKCIGCHKCTNVCPIINHFNKKTDYEKKIYAVYSKDSNIQKSSSSGGVFSELAKIIISQNGIVFGSAFDNNFTLTTIGITTEDALYLLRGSKYIQSDIGTVFLQIKSTLNKGRKVLFCGTPCQIAGLYAYLDYNDDNLFTIDLVCYGVPSPVVFEKYKAWLEGQYGKLISFSFRDKKFSWKAFNIKAVMERGTYYGTWEEDPYMRGFLREYFLRKSCHVCRFANTNRLADITLADFWGYRSRLGKFRDRDQGISMVLINTPQGEKLFNQMSYQVYYIETPLQEAVKGNRALSSCFPPSEKREAFWQDFDRYSFETIIPRYLFPEKIQFTRRILYKYGKQSYCICSFLIRCYSFLKQYLHVMIKHLFN
jgi:coenzyme F420-reducing hydrogenase beta subunit